MTTTPPTLLLICRDLMASSQIEGQARAAGFTVTIRPSIAAAGEYVASNSVSVFVIELLENASDLPDLIATGIPVFVYASHVYERELNAARELGAVTFSRGQIASQLTLKLRELVKLSEGK
ncbi:MAG: hypothetical protein KDA66_09855 [Planctomycetaceae bacterium]|nr:hypothetical protein [Planctomycetaceae bacterium]MCB9952326.1 hypothetical protein [Planctomycetaceae bacterium]